VDVEILNGISECKSKNYHLHKDDIRWYDVFFYEQALLNKKDIWCLMPEHERLVFEKIIQVSNEKVGNVFDNEVFVGLQTSADAIYIGFARKRDDTIFDFIPSSSKSKDYESKYGTNQKEFPIESAILKKLLLGKDIEKWGIEWRELYLIFPYHFAGNGAELINEIELSEKYPNTWAYLNIFKRSLEHREGGLWDGVDNWYEYGRGQSINKFHHPKLIIQNNSNTNRVYFDENGEFYFTGSGGVYPPLQI
jgi:hypothetical protein